VTYAVTKTSAGGSTKMCAKVDAGAFGCKVLACPTSSRARPTRNTTPGP
jgi:hypothetical protein